MKMGEKKILTLKKNSEAASKRMQQDCTERTQIASGEIR